MVKKIQVDFCLFQQTVSTALAIHVSQRLHTSKYFPIVSSLNTNTHILALEVFCQKANIICDKVKLDTHF